jgi:hypothetical protein
MVSGERDGGESGEILENIQKIQHQEEGAEEDEK